MTAQSTVTASAPVSSGDLNFCLLDKDLHACYPKTLNTNCGSFILKLFNVDKRIVSSGFLVFPVNVITDAEDAFGRLVTLVSKVYLSFSGCWIPGGPEPPTGAPTAFRRVLAVPSCGGGCPPLASPVHGLLHSRFTYCSWFSEELVWRKCCMFFFQCLLDKTCMIYTRSIQMSDVIIF